VLFLQQRPPMHTAPPGHDDVHEAGTAMQLNGPMPDDWQRRLQHSLPPVQPSAGPPPFG
jgi:hypothetical protein